MKLVLLADARPESGSGHRMRLLAIREAALALGHEARLHDVPDDALATARAAAGADWLVVDGYNYDAAWRSLFKKAVGSRLKLAVLDDLAAPGTAADLIVNPSPGAVGLRSLYDRESDVLLGARFAPLRPAFKTAPRPRRAAAARSILFSFGTSAAAKNDVLTTAAADLCRRGFQVRAVERGLGAEEMRQILESADLAVTAGGVTSLECARLGTPQIVLSIADNQRPNAQGLAAAGSALDVGALVGVSTRTLGDAVVRLADDAAARQRMSQAGPALVDGAGAERIIRRMAGAPHGSARLRPTRAEDGAWLWHLANDPEARRLSFSPASIPWEDHRVWLDRLLTNRDRRAWVLELCPDEPAGHIHFAREKDRAVVSVNLAPEFRGRGLGAEMLKLGSEAAAAEWGAVTLEAHIKDENAASRGAFLKAGYSQGEPCQIHPGCSVHRLKTAA